MGSTINQKSVRMRLSPSARAWLRRWRACQPGYRWASYHCETLREVVETPPPDWMRWVAARALPPAARAEWLARALDRGVAAGDDPRTLAVAPALRRWAAGQIGNDEMERVAAASAIAYSAADSAAIAATVAARSVGRGGADIAADSAAIAAAFAACSAGVGAAESDAQQRRDALELLDAAGWPDEART